MFLSRPLLLLTLLGLAMLATARPLNNAQRLSRGLPLAKPNRLFDATRARALQPRASMTPAISAIIAFYRNQTDTSPIGYLNYTASGSNQYYITMTTNITAASILSLPNSGVTTQNIITGPVSARKYLASEMQLSNATNYGVDTPAPNTGNNYLAFLFSANQDNGNPLNTVTLSGRQETSQWNIPAGGYGWANLTYTDYDGTVSSPNFYLNLAKKSLLYATMNYTELHNSPASAWNATDQVFLKYMAPPA